MTLPLWFVFALSASVLVGTYSFLTKISVERKHDKHTILLVMYGSGLLAAVVLFFIWGEYTTTLLLTALAVINALAYYLNISSRMVALKYMTSSGYFITYRIFSSILILIGGILFFGDKLSMFEAVGFLLGFLIFYLLIEKKEEAHSKKDLMTGYKFLFLGIVLISITQLGGKLVVDKEFNIYTYLLLYSVFSFVFAMIGGAKKTSYKKIYQSITREELIVGTALGIIGTLSVLFIAFAFIDGDVGIVYKTVSYSLVIPILFSILFFGEKVSLKKAGAFVLTVISLWLFV